VTVVPPPAQPGANAAVIALSPSGLGSSSFAPAAAPPVYSYADNGSPSIEVTPNAVSAGSDAVLDLTGANLDFAVSGLRLGFGTSDIVVRHVWLLSAQHAQIAISVSPTAPQGFTTLTLIAGLQLVENPLSFRITQPLTLPWARVSGAAPSSLTPGLSSSQPLLVPIENVPANSSAANFTVAIATPAGDTPVSVLSFLNGPILIDLPLHLPSGPLTLKITYNGTPLAPAVVDVRAADPMILQASSYATGSVYTDSGPAYAGDLVSMLVLDLAADIAPVDLSSVSVSVGGVAQTVYAVELLPLASNLYSVQFRLNPGGQVQGGSSSKLPLTIAADSRVSAPFAFPAAALAALSLN
jgi:hypothetical protein